MSGGIGNEVAAISVACMRPGGPGVSPVEGWEERKERKIHVRQGRVRASGACGRVCGGQRIACVMAVVFVPHSSPLGQAKEQNETSCA
jgi:hypothetical protein